MVPPSLFTSPQALLHPQGYCTHSRVPGKRRSKWRLCGFPGIFSLSGNPGQIRASKGGTDPPARVRTGPCPQNLHGNIQTPTAAAFATLAGQEQHQAMVPITPHIPEMQLSWPPEQISMSAIKLPGMRTAASLSFPKEE